ncbi:16S rRNA (adenine(1518)-N(6)/adenine(1519)-N(6))-dimethyltransferase RsmA [Marinibactrum halimedae]|uniref:Ribosomal RNA small subunit methyltransferase A n=1 Tax=Marinibactrum halimedae TaxID=1444977 RepID=A0AA37WL62_9GAMM|nr:16S rRNA (adenine(1518)-N(6)/adenine(1519)-N(6))-dimethyltransferase RsmA [Marinibactrum halimedae]MCD9459559.1 16S rRNA (adenine(1518)-N(6)/adenine(1519)-N(6))-dimethyltransferase RsmA [Marinibactrum halimedae]GLS25624.1 ribosomal RNA small subunit methyltransferase A [Marinibactrum halimedae]
MTKKTILPTGLQHKARKRFGQNFLHDYGVISSIVRAIGPRESDNLVEIGPGKGAITALLLEQCPNLNVIELDRDLVPILLAQFVKYPGFKIHQIDALKFDFASLATTDNPLRVVGNLPYNISTPLIFHLLSFHQRIKDMHFMLQKEVVERLAAQPGDKAYGRLSVMTQYYCDVENLFLVPPECFDPAPKVDSAIVRLTPHTNIPCPTKDIDILHKVVNVAFQQRRKTLRNALKGIVTSEQCEQLGIDASVRPEMLSLRDYVAIADFAVDQND